MRRFSARAIPCDTPCFLWLPPRACEQQLEGWRIVVQARPEAAVIDLDSTSPMLHPWILCEELGTAPEPLLIALITEPSQEVRVRALRLGVDLVLASNDSAEELIAFLEAQRARRRVGAPDHKTDMGCDYYQ